VQIPTLGFLYVAGYIGHVGRAYVMAVKNESKISATQQKEIIIDVPMALRMAVTGFAWPVQVIAELKAGTLTAKPEDITVSPR
jgi:photosystem I subunit 3